jgi:hypothetical protein
MSVWNNIYDNIKDTSIKLVCLFIGCSMDYYTELTEENNQQYPCFLNKINGKKLIILIDPYLESPLKIENYFIGKNNPLICINTIFNKDKISIRIFNNNETTVYALNESINYIKYKWIDNKCQPDTHKIYNIIELCLNRKIKFILQDFSGNDTTYFYTKLLKKYNRNDLLHYINLDVTQNEGGCRFLLNYDLIKIDENENFIQEKFLELSKIKNSNLYNICLNLRIDMFIYPIAYYYSQIIQGIELELDNLQLYKIGFISIIYNIDFDEESRDLNYMVIQFQKLIEKILIDIINSKEIDISLYDYIMTNIHDRQLLYKTMRNLKNQLT